MNRTSAFEVVESAERQLPRGNAAIDAGPCVTVRETGYSVRYLGTDGNIRTRAARLYSPAHAAAGKQPLVFNVHYELRREDKELYDLLRQGWSVLTNIDIPLGHIANIAGDDLRFNMALLDMARRLPHVDPGRIALRGGSAGGYQTWMLCTTHLAIVAAYSLWGPVNLSYQMKYLFDNQRINEAYAPNVADPDKSNGSLYPVPGVFGAYGLIRDTARWLGADNMEDDRWKPYSPVLFVQRVTNPLLAVHSTADLFCPLNPVSGTYAYRTADPDLPASFRTAMSELLQDAELRIPLDERLSAEELNLFRLTPAADKRRWPAAIPFDPAKPFNLAVVDEGAPGKACQHWKNGDCGDALSEMAYMAYYLPMTAAQTNRLTAAKTQFLAWRFLGETPLCAGEQAFKRQCPDDVFGSLHSDRRDVLQSILAYCGVDAAEAVNGTAYRHVQTNVDRLLACYGQLGKGFEFLGARRALERDPVGLLLDRYASMSGSV